MKSYISIAALFFGLFLWPTIHSQAQAEIAITTTVKKVLKAIDLKIQREQNKVIWLQNAQKTIENVMSKLKLEEIGDWVEKQRNIYREYFDELHKVKTLITYYQQIRNIAGKQIKLVEEYKRAWRLIKKDTHFTPEEIDYMGRVYEGILNETVQHIDQLTIVITSFATSMSDAKRMKIIADVDEQVDINLTDLRRFNTENALLSLNRAKSESEIRMVKQLYGLTD
ncbi:MAG: conjugal transfer protein TraI [Sphingobacteriales bacterium]|nr:conjugal transfer protein TraI [Sphingobacteriales bacterium]OJV98823.1 MAG: conjugal transfer protein TraI [Sphingobacteriales bacterium 44-61]